MLALLLPFWITTVYMASLAPQRATTLKEAFRICDVAPLAGEDLKRYYVPLDELRKSEAVEFVSAQLEFQDQGQFQCILFTGHRGSGKSTELKRLQQQWHQEFEVIYLEVDDETDLNDARYTDIYLIIIKHLGLRMQKLGLQFEPQLLANFEDWFKEITNETEDTVAKSVNAEAEASLGAEAPFLAKLIFKLQAQIKGSRTQKRKIRDTLQKEVSRLKSDANALLQDAMNKLQRLKPNSKGFLVIFDNLDRVPPEVGDHLFFDYSSQLRELRCTTLFTVPISVLCSPRNVSNAFEQPNLVSMPNVYKLNRDKVNLDFNEEAVAKLATLLESRIDIDAVFDDREQTLELVRHSGGHVRQLFQMARLALQKAYTQKKEKVTADEVTYGFKQLQFAFERAARENHYGVMAQVCVDKDITKDDVGQLLLFSTAVLEYNGDDRWNYPNQAVLASQAFQEVLNDVRSKTQQIVDG